MKSTLIKLTAAAGLIGALAVADVTPSQARNGNVAAFAAGVGVGALGGAAIASSGYGGYGYGPGYYAYGGPRYAYYGGWRHRYHRHWGYYR